MRNFLLSLAAVVVVAALAPWVVGGVSRNRLQGEVENLNRHGTLECRIVDFDGGWRRSTAHVLVGLSEAYRAQVRASAAEGGEVPEWLDRKVPLRVDLAHGPLLLGDGVAWGWSRFEVHPDGGAPEAVYLNRLLGSDAELDGVRAGGRVEFGGGVDFAVTSAALAADLGEVRVEWAPWQLTGRVDGARVSADFASEFFRVTGPDGIAELSGLRGSSDVDRVLGSLGVGRSEVGVDRLMMRTVGAEGEVVVFGLEAASMVSDFELRPGGEIMGGTIDYAVAGVNLPTGSVVTDLSVHVEMDNFGVEALRSMNTVMQPAGMTADPVEMGERFRRDVARLLERRPELVIDPVRLLVDGAAVEASVRMAGRPVEGDVSDEVLRSPEFWQRLLTIEADLAVPKPLVLALAGDYFRRSMGMALEETQVVALLGAMAEQGVLIDEGAVYRTALVFEEGRMTINGNLMPGPR